MKKLFFSVVLAWFAATAVHAQLFDDKDHWVQKNAFPDVRVPTKVTPVPAGANISPYVRDGLILIKGYSDRDYLMHIDQNGYYVFGYDLELTDGNKVVGLFSGGAATAYRHGKPVVLTSEGHVLIPPAEYRMITDFKDGVAVVLKGDGFSNEVVYIDTKMREIYPELTQKEVGYSAANDLKPTGILSENMRAYFDVKSKLWGYMDHHGKPVIEPRFLEALPFREGRAAVQVETEKWGPRLWGFIDVTGRFRIDPVYQVKPTSFRSGYAAVHTGDGFGDTMLLIDRSGNERSGEAAWTTVPCDGFCFYKLLPQYRDGNTVRVATAAMSDSDGAAAVSFNPGVKSLPDYLSFTLPVEDLNGESGLIFYRSCAAVGKYDDIWKTTMGTIISSDGTPTQFTTWQEFDVKAPDGSVSRVSSDETRNHFYGFYDQSIALFTYGIGKKQASPEMGWVRGFVSGSGQVAILFRDLSDDEIGDELDSRDPVRRDVGLK